MVVVRETPCGIVKWDTEVIDSHEYLLGIVLRWDGLIVIQTTDITECGGVVGDVYD